MCESYNRQYGTDYRSVMPTNLYGPGDNYHPENSHVIPALIQRFHAAKNNGAKEVVIWGTGTPRREFLYVDDMASASIHVMELEEKMIRENTEPMRSHINIGSGADVMIGEVAELIARVVGFQGKIVFDTSKSDGAPRKWLDASCLNRLGWMPSVTLEEGLIETYQSFRRAQVQLDKRAQGRALDPISRVKRQSYKHANAATANPLS